MRTLRVLTVTNAFPNAKWGWSSGIFVQELVEALAHVAVRSDVHVIRGQDGAWRYLTAPFGVITRQIRGSYDIIHAHFGLAAATVVTRGLPLVITYHGSDLHSKWQRVISRSAAKRAQARIVVSGRLAELLGDEEADVIPCGVNMDRFHPRNQAECRDLLGWEPGAKYLLFPGRPGRAVKNYGLFRAVVTELSQRSWNVKVLCLDGSIRRDQMPLVLSAADAMLLTSRSEGSPQSVKEALAVGLPVVATDVGDVRAMLAGVEPGAVLDADVPAMTTALEEVLRLGRRSNGAERLRELRLDWHDVACRTREVYERVLACVRV